MDVLRNAPEASTFVPLAEHQSRTPSSFYEGPPVLHYHSERCKIVILEHELAATPALSALRGESAAASSEQDDAKEIAIEGIETWVTSDKLLLFSSIASTGVQISYPSISLHALQRLRVPGTESPEVQGLYMQIATPSAPSADDVEECITMTIVLPADAPTQETSDGSGETETPTQIFYNSVSACSNLHPDPVEPGDEDEDDEEGNKWFSAEDADGVVRLGDGDLPPPVAGSSGWITAENMGEFFDEDGNWIAGGEPPSFPLGPGAGTVRTREGENGADENGEGEDDEAKWRRTE
ncbi:hypothetical protein PENANT_c004G10815 [Penicillium antarcticum]|uniref:Regulator of volume decrease after cellular swelling-domain-containing protein n=1 Tax=Penicillium antarcticum TaxID=416450 RepID=A0A1V6QHG5_9EURO|nr:uncharacterized protein N7508_002303 [Penicillium antarcticum]KAJ5317795.1 hypothetical protein N7508_002303 [Penicillium antarcticum]OQD88397.1 hypothetical protein PENANT_c004G10815 [Penicillium antarcticum]